MLRLAIWQIFCPQVILAVTGKVTVAEGIGIGEQDVGIFGQWGSAQQQGCEKN